MRCDLHLLLDSAKVLKYDRHCTLEDSRIDVSRCRVLRPEMERASRIWKCTEQENLPLLVAQATWDETDAVENLLARGAELALERGLR